jgi:hypothetical protein
MPKIKDVNHFRDSCLHVAPNKVNGVLALGDCWHGEFADKHRTLPELEFPILPP